MAQPGQLYSDNLGNALGSGIAQGVNAFTARQDYNDQVNKTEEQKQYDRAQAAKSNQKQDAKGLYDHLAGLSDRFTTMQKLGGQQGLSALEREQAGDANSKAQKIMGLLTAGKYDEANAAFSDFQNHMDTVTQAGPGPVDGGGNPVAGPPVPVTTQQSAEGMLNNQIGQGNQNLGSLAFRTTAAQATGAENTAALGTAEVTKVQATLQSTIDLMKSENNAGKVKADIYVKFQKLAEGAEQAQYLAGIARTGAAGAAIIKNLDPEIVPQALKDAAIASATNAQDVENEGARGAKLTNDVAAFGLTRAQNEAPYALRGMEIANQFAEGTLLQQGVDLSKSETDLDRAQTELTAYKSDQPLQHDLMQASLDTARIQVTIARATQNGEIDAKNAMNYGEIAKRNPPPEYWDELGKTMGPDGKTPLLSPALVAAYKTLTKNENTTSLAQRQILQGNAKVQTVAGNVAEKTQSDQILGVHYDTQIKNTQRKIGETDLQYEDRIKQLQVQQARLQNTGIGYQNTSLKATAGTAEGMAQAGLTAAQSGAKVSTIQANYASPMADAALQTARAQGSLATTTAANAPALQRAEVSSAQSKATVDAVTAQYAGRTALAQVTLAEAQRDSAKYSAIYDGATLQDKIAAAPVALQLQKTSLQSALADLKVNQSTVGARIQAMNLGNNLSVADLSTRAQSLLDMKQAYAQQGKKNPKELDAMDIALKTAQADLLTKLGDNSLSNHDKVQVYTQLKNSNNGLLNEMIARQKAFISTYKLSGKITVDQFDPKNFLQIFPALVNDPAAKTEAAAIFAGYQKYNTTNEEIQQGLSGMAKSDQTNSPIPQGKQGFQAVYDLAKQAGDPHPEIVAAQWALESGYGKSPSGKNNLFGIKAAGGQTGTSLPTTEFVNGRRVSTTANFANYDSPLAGVQARVDFLKDNPRYGNAGYFTAGTAGDAARALESAGYATDKDKNGNPVYASKLISILKANGFDPDAKKPVVADPIPKANPEKAIQPVPADGGIPGRGPGTSYKSSGGDTYVSHNLNQAEMKALDDAGFFRQGKILTQGATPASDKLFASYTQLLFGGSYTPEQEMTVRRELVPLAKQIK